MFRIEEPTDFGDRRLAGQEATCRRAGEFLVLGQLQVHRGSAPLASFDVPATQAGLPTSL